MTLRALMTLSLISVLISGCTSTGGGFKYIYPTKADLHISRSLKEQIVEHNEFCEQQGSCTEPDIVKTK